jgi:hypothetical protein
MHKGLKLVTIFQGIQQKKKKRESVKSERENGREGGGRGKKTSYVTIHSFSSSFFDFSFLSKILITFFMNLDSCWCSEELSAKLSTDTSDWLRTVTAHTGLCQAIDIITSSSMHLTIICGVTSTPSLNQMIALVTLLQVTW